MADKTPNLKRYSLKVQRWAAAQGPDRANTLAAIAAWDELREWRATYASLRGVGEFASVFTALDAVLGSEDETDDTDDDQTEQDGDQLVAYTTPTGDWVCVCCAPTLDVAAWGELVPVYESDQEKYDIFTVLKSQRPACSRCDRTLAEAFFEVHPDELGDDEMPLSPIDRILVQEADERERQESELTPRDPITPLDMTPKRHDVEPKTDPITTLTPRNFLTDDKDEDA